MQSSWFDDYEEQLSPTRADIPTKHRLWPIVLFTLFGVGFLVLLVIGFLIASHPGAF
ncbi:MAG TPA: hypothetical protein VKZ49_15000 [Polyangiaceae bacterium]|nr:hypothetical protein [Polyangiaceae bacterium]